MPKPAYETAQQRKVQTQFAGREGAYHSKPRGEPGQMAAMEQRRARPAGGPEYNVQLCRLPGASRVVKCV